MDSFVSLTVSVPRKIIQILIPGYVLVLRSAAPFLASGLVRHQDWSGLPDFTRSMVSLIPYTPQEPTQDTSFSFTLAWLGLDLNVGSGLLSHQD